MNDSIKHECSNLSANMRWTCGFIFGWGGKGKGKSQSKGKEEQWGWSNKGVVVMGWTVIDAEMLVARHIVKAPRILTVIHGKSSSTGQPELIDLSEDAQLQGGESFFGWRRAFRTLLATFRIYCVSRVTFGRNGTWSHVGGAQKWTTWGPTAFAHLFFFPTGCWEAFLGRTKQLRDEICIG